MTIRRPRTYNTTERAQNDAFKGLDTSLSQIDTVLLDHEERLDVWEQSRIMSVDKYTLLYFPCDEIAAATGIVSHSATQAVLLKGATCTTGDISNMAVGCARTTDGAAATRLASGGSGIFPGGAVSSISFKFMMGNLATPSYVFGYYNNAPNGIFWVDYDATGLLSGHVRIGGATFNATAATIAYPGTWHSIVLTHDGANLKLYLDGALSPTSVTAAGGTPEWGLAGTKAWIIGSIPVVFGGFIGQIRDVRVHAAPRQLAWVQEDWLRFNREWPEA